MKQINNIQMKKVQLVFLFFISITTLQAQLLWKITGKNLKNPSYLFGTNALIPPGFADSIPNIYKCFNKCNTVVCEITMNSIDNQKKLYNAALLPHGITLDKLITADNYKIVDNEVKSVLKIGLNELSAMQPQLILNMYKTELNKIIFGYKSEYHIDSFFQLAGSENGKNIIGLETIDKQISLLFDTTNIRRQAEILVESIVNKENMIVDMKNMNRMYKVGNITELYNLANRQERIIDMTKEEFTKTVDNRNFTWLRQIPVLMKYSSCFIAVDAIHLQGENGLIKLLQKEGYKVKSVK